MKDQISYFKSSRSYEPATITIDQAVHAVRNGTRHTPEILRYRETGDKDIKRNLPAFVFGAVCEGGHKMSNVVQRTGWVSLDFDQQQNPGITDWEHFRDQVSNIVYVAFAALSVGGSGVWALVKISDPGRQSEHYRQLQRDFTSLGVVPDSTKGRNANDLRYLSYDPEAKANRHFKIYDRLPAPEQPKKRQYRSQPITGNVFESAMKFAKRSGATFTHGSDMHRSIFLLCTFLNYAGVPQAQAEAWINANILALDQIQTNCITGPYKSYANKHGTGKISYNHKHDFNPYTGEVIDERGYPATWDNISNNQPYKTQ